MVSIQVFATPMRLGEVIIGEPDALGHGAGGGAVAALGERRARAVQLMPVALSVTPVICHDCSLYDRPPGRDSFSDESDKPFLFEVMIVG